MATTIKPAAQPRLWRKWTGRILRITVASYLGIVLVLMFFENRMVFVPTHHTDDWWDAPSASWEDVILESEDGTRLHAWWCPHPGATGALLYCHGNAGNLSHRGRTIQAIHAELGVSVLIFDYPGYGKSEGRPTEAGCYAAGEAGYRWLTREKQIPDQKVLFFGNSLGGGVATYLAEKHPHQALILSKTFTSLPDVGQGLYPFLPIRWLMRNRFDSLSRIKNCTRPVFITHGKEDGLIPFSHAESLYEAANSPKFFLPVEDGDHNSPLNREFFNALKSFLAEAEAPSKGTSVGAKLTAKK
jgi:fermentation-respiration switch protein FrsA (DUF1100 family)